MDRLISVIIFGLVCHLADGLPFSSNLTMTVDVPFGKSARLNFDGIFRTIDVDKSNPHCVVRIVQEPIYSRFGAVSAREFGCLNADIIYWHYAFESPNEDVVKFRVSFFTPADYIQHTFYVILRILDERSANIIGKGFPLRVSERNGLSSAITANSVKLNQESSDLPDFCHIHLVKDVKFPRFGRLSIPDDGHLTCAQFFAGDIHYERTAESFSNRDLVILKLETLNENSESQFEFFQMTVQIEHGFESDPPQIAFSATLLLDVQNFVIASITRDILLTEGVSDEIIYHVTQTPDPIDGFLIRLDDPLHPIDSFTQQDVNAMKIAFRPALMDFEADRLSEIVLEILDVQSGLSSTEAVPLMIVIHPASYFAPFVVFNTGLTLFEGRAATLSSRRNLAVADEDNYPQLRMRVVSGLAHGRLIKDAANIKEFSSEDLDKGQVIYQHDGSNTMEDSIVIQMDDGENQVEFLIAITVLPIDDEPPLLVSNTGILVHRANEIVPVTNKILRAKDMDSLNQAIYYNLTSSTFWGHFVIRDPNDERNNQTVTSWSQADIDANRLFYQNQADESQVSSTWFSVDFSLQDSNKPPNMSPNIHLLTVTFLPKDIRPPLRSPGANFKLRVNQSETAVINNKILHFTDDFTSDRNLMITVQKAPVVGSLVWSNGHESSPSTFPQSALSYGEIVYQAPQLVESEELVKDELVVSVRDHAGNELRDETLEIFIEAPRARRPRFSHKPPAVWSKVILIKETQTVIIDDDYLLISDPDTHLSSITIHLRLPPTMGMLVLRNKSLATGDSFTGEDVAGQMLSYQNNNSISSEDLIRLSVTDSDHESVLIDIHIRIIPSPATPAPRGLLGLSKLGMVLSVPEDSEFALTRNVLLGSSQAGSYPPSDLTFHLDHPPQTGSLFLNGTETESFSWRDVEQRSVVYKSHAKQFKTGNGIFDDDLSLSIAPITDEWILNDKIIDHLEIQILLVPKIASVRSGKKFSVGEGQSAILTEEHLVVPPRSQKIVCSSVGASLHGDLIDMVRRVPISHFTNLDILEHRIHYNQSVHHRTEPRADSIRLSCNGKFIEILVEISPANDEEPSVLGGEIQVSAGDEVLIGAFISVIDSDEPADTISIEIMRFPQHGLILFNFTQEDPNEIQIEPLLRPVRNFSAVHLLHPGKILYRHDGSSSLNDDFVIRATDGVNSVEKTVNVIINSRELVFDDDVQYGLMEFIPKSMELIGKEMEIVYYDPKNESHVQKFPPLNWTMPEVTLTTPNRPLFLLPNKHLGLVLTTDWLNITRNSTSSQKELLIEVIQPPKFGAFVDPQNPDRVYNIFPESLLNGTDRRNIAYALNPKHEKVTRDTFTIQAIDEFGDRSSVIEGEVRWSWMSFMKDRYETSENNGVVRIGVIRRGWLQNREFVAVKSRDLSATMGRDYKEDFALQAEFQPGQSESFIEIKILKDDIYEDKEVFQLILEEPQFSNIEKPFVTTVAISDQDESPMIFIPQPVYMIKESVGLFNLTLKRSGRDLSQAMSVICHTTDGTATGTISHSYQMFRPDFVTRLNIHSSAVTFYPNQTMAICPIIIVNDRHAEPEESFTVHIRPLSHSRIGVYSEAEVVIIRDPDDEPRVTFTRKDYDMTFLDPMVDVQVERHGGDMQHPSEVDILTDDGQKLEKVYFAPGESSQVVTLRNLDSLKQKNNWFKIFLNSSQSLDTHQAPQAKIHVSKRLNFTAMSSVGGGLTTNEIILLGNYDSPPELDLSAAPYDCVSCNEIVPLIARKLPLAPYNSISPITQSPLAATKPTKQPKVDSDYIQLYPQKDVADTKNEDEAKERLLDMIEGLTAPVTRGVPPTAPLSTVGKGTFLRRKDPTIYFGNDRYEIVEPLSPKRLHWITIPVIRDGDITQSDIVRVITKDGTAKAGIDYEPLDTVVNFESNRSQDIVQIRIIFDEARESSENFTVHLYGLRRTRATVTKGMAVVTIHEQAGDNVRFPGPPLVTSLENYERPIVGGWLSIGQPCACITTCNPRHPNYSRTRQICDMEGVDDNQTIYDWRVSHPLVDSNMMEPLQSVRSSVWFASTNGPVLDSLYFSNGSLVMCSARAVTFTGHGGYESESAVVTAVNVKPKCPFESIRSSSAVTIDPFRASIASAKNGSITISVFVPHRIGLVPLISTSPIRDLYMLLSPEGTRTVEHLCSNLLSSDELRATKHGFFKTLPVASNLRGNRTEEFYSNLDENSCQWQFHAIYTLSEITDICGGRVLNEQMTHSATGKRELSIRVPLYVTYAYFTNSLGNPWKHYDQSTTLDLVYVYDSVKTLGASENVHEFRSLQAEMSASQAETRSDYNSDEPGEKYSAEIRLIQVKIADGSTHVNGKFKTKPAFRGKFLTSGVRDSDVAKVVFTYSPRTEFELKLLRTQENTEYPQQLWRFRTMRAAKMNYRGVYNISLVPCEFQSGTTTTCDMKPTVTFQIRVTESD